MKKLLITLFISIQTMFSFSQCNELFISEYIEGSGNNKAIEIYNPTSSTILLTGNYALRQYFNGSGTPTNFPLTGSIAPNTVFIFCTTTSDPTILAVADQTTGASWFNGDDAVELFNNISGTAVDVIGVIGNDPGSEWTLNSVSGTANHTLVRKQTVQQGNLVWVASGELEWDIFPQDDFTHLDAHTMNPCGPTPLTADFTFTNVCQGTMMSFTDATTGGDNNYTYAWDFGDGSGTSTLANPTYMYTSAGTYTVNLIVTDGVPTIDNVSYVVTVHQKPDMTSTPSATSGCAPLNVCFTTNVTGGGPNYTFAWDFGDGNSATTMNPCNDYITDATFNWQVIVTDQNNCKDTATNSIIVNPLDDPSFNYSSTSYCINDGNQTVTITGLTGGTFSGSAGVDISTGELNLVNMGAGNHTITYTTGGTCPNSSQVILNVVGNADATITTVGDFCCGSGSTAINLVAATAGGTWSGPGIVNAAMGTFDCATVGVGINTVTYTIAGSCGGSDTEDINVIMTDYLDIYNNDTIICNDIFGFFLNAETGGTWSGTFVNDNSNGAGFFSSAAITPGTYYAVYSTSSTCPFEDSIMIDVYDYPVANFSFTSILGDVTFTDLSTNAVTYDWDFDDGNTSNLQNPMHTFALNGTYNVCLTVTNSVGCENITCQTVSINGLGIENNSKVDFKVYPNPSNGNVTIESNSIITKITVKNLLGQNVFSKNINSTNGRIEMTNIDAGFYFIEIETEKGKAVKRIEIVK